MAHATTQQIIQAFKGLTPRERKGLRFAGDRLSEAMGSDGGCDLLQEALLRMLDGRRKWPLHIRFDFYVYRVMDSIAHGERKRHRHELGFSSPFDHCDAGGGWRCPGPTPEQAAIAAEELRLAARAALRARLSLGSDLDRAVLDGMLDGETPAEIRAALRLASRDYELARQRVMGRLRAVGLAEGLARPAPAKPKPKADGDDGAAGSPPPAKPSRRPRR
ncbi:hypothetical protein [Paraburkholderia sp. SUR17]|uniref:hypothetical protein n=1 Tax=Burkholderiaceae TaxID=119060 RepID=UPI0024080770|nr:hypothetical protein [Paraburkholderia sp. SUR17]WEY40099.1 hypothetical protein P2869_07000 [Paraburkholderia sp. SUR17]